MGAPQGHCCHGCCCGRCRYICPVGREVQDELAAARRLFPRPSASAHEAFAVLKEEVDELWDVVKRKSHGDQKDRKADMRKEAIQIAAMAVRFVEEICDK